MSLPADLIERALTAADLPALTALARACDETYLGWAPPGWTVPEAPPGFATKYLTPSAWMHGAFDRSGALVATVAFRVADHDSAVAHVGLVFVHPLRWRERIAGTLLTLAEAEMVARGFVREQLWTPDGAPAEHFYTARGWSRDGRTEWHPWFGLQMVGYARDLKPPKPSTGPRRAEPRAPESRVAESRVAEPHVAEPHVAEPHVPEPGAAEPRAAEPNVAEPRPPGPRVAESRAPEPRLAESGAADTRDDAALSPRGGANEVAPSSPSGGSSRRRGSWGGRARERRGDR